MSIAGLREELLPGWRELPEKSRLFDGRSRSMELREIPNPASGSEKMRRAERRDDWRLISFEVLDSLLRVDPTLSSS